MGMCGAGKSEVAQYLMKKREFGFVRFGQITLDKVKELREKSSEKLEKKIRDGLRKKYGMAAFAKLNMPQFNVLLKEGDVIGDGLYSWEEYLELKEKYDDRLIVLAVYAAPKIRYRRLENRAKRHGEDSKLRYRSFTKGEAASRDKSEIEKSHKAGPIAMADYTFINEGTLGNLYSQVDEVCDRIFRVKDGKVRTRKSNFRKNKI